jgi:hypothetical protein
VHVLAHFRKGLGVQVQRAPEGIYRYGRWSESGLVFKCQKALGVQ